VRAVLVAGVVVFVGSALTVMLFGSWTDRALVVGLGALCVGDVRRLLSDVCIPSTSSSSGDGGAMNDPVAVLDLAEAAVDPLLDAGRAIAQGLYGVAAVELEQVADLASKASRMASRMAREVHR
jgi:hypothetical protein